MAIVSSGVEDKVRGQRTLVVTFDADGSFKFQAPRLVSLSVQATGTFGAGTLSLQGGNDGTNFAALGTAISFTAAGAKGVAQADLGFKWYNLNLAGSTSPSITVTVVMGIRT